VVELEDLSRFEQVFYVSAKTEYGIEALKTYFLEIAEQSPEKKDHIENEQKCKI
jgi:hypothetical protein